MISLNTDISFGRKNALPTKKSINLYIVKSNKRQNIISLILFGVYLIGLFFFVQFAVIGQIQKVNRLEQQYNNSKQQYEVLHSKNSEYDKVLQEYSHYGNGYLSSDESTLQDRLDILKIAEEQILDKDALESITIKDNQATLVINTEKLASVSALAAELESYDIVSYVTVNTSAQTYTGQISGGNAQAAGSSDNGAVVSTMEIYFKSAAEGSAQ